MGNQLAKRPGQGSLFLLGILTTLTAALFVTRVLVAASAITITHNLLNTVSSLATGLCMAGTFVLAWWRTSRTQQAEIDELREQVQEMEDHAWWGTPPRKRDEEDTVRLGPNVVPLRKSS